MSIRVTSLYNPDQGHEEPHDEACGNCDGFGEVQISYYCDPDECCGECYSDSETEECSACNGSGMHDDSPGGNE